MSHINLLPWRENIILYKNRLFGAIAGLIAAGSLIANLILAGTVNLQNSAEQQKIATLNIALQETQAIITEVDSFEEEKKNLLERNRIIHNLQNKKVFLTQLLNDFVTIIPNGIQLSEITMLKQEILLKGASPSDSKIFKLIQNLEALSWITSATFKDIYTKEEEDIAQQMHKKDNSTNDVFFVIQINTKQDQE